MAPKVLWLGSRRPGDDGARFLSAAGFAVDALPATQFAPPPSANAPDVVVVALRSGESPSLTLRPLIEALPPESKVLALVAHPSDVVAALVAGAHDAVGPRAGDELGDELYVRVLGWARLAARERQQRAALGSLLDRVRALESDALCDRRTIDSLRDLTHRDDLTGLGNRRSFSEALAHALASCARYGGPVSVVVADLDGMKRLNDTCGHPAGDAALRTVAEVLHAQLRSVDHAARLGGDEFGIVMPSTPASGAALVAERIRDRIDALVLPLGAHLSASFGVAAAGQPRGGGFAADELTARADAALYRAKRAGKNRVAIDGTPDRHTEAA